jgi:DNA-binding beta-propeller fold protein YncE
MGDGNTIKRFNGTTGAFLGNFTAPGAGGLATTLDFVFTPNGKLLVSGTGTSNSVLQFDGSSGTFLGVFAQGNGLSTPFGMTIGPDGNLYVASTTGSNSIARFDLDTGAFLGNFVNTTAHSGPTYIQFTPFPIPEPTSLVLVFAAFGAGAVGAARKVGSRQRISDLS